jgi:hypothetical protein
MRYSEPFTAEWARERMRYEPDTGRLVWKTARKAQFVGKESRSIDVSGYVQVNFRPGLVVKGHRLAWLLHYGEWPKSDLDHINGDRADNRIENLRCVTNAVNCQNKRRPLSSNKSGFLGVTAHGSSWRAAVMVNRRQHHLGSYASPEEAHAAYVEAKRRLHEGCTL